MIEVNLFSVASTDPTTMIGRCISRNRFNPESLGVSVMEFVKGFLRDNMDNLETSIANADLVSLINSETVGFSVKDFASVQYYLSKVGYKVEIWNVTDDEENAVGVPTGDLVEWNVIDKTFLQSDYPTVTKIMPAPGQGIDVTLREIVEQSGLFNPEKFSGIRSPFADLLGHMSKEATTAGRINPAIVTQIYSLLSQLGIEVFCALSEN